MHDSKNRVPWLRVRLRAVGGTFALGALMFAVGAAAIVAMQPTAPELVSPEERTEMRARIARADRASAADEDVTSPDAEWVADGQEPALPYSETPSRSALTRTAAGTAPGDAGSGGTTPMGEDDADSSGHATIAGHVVHEVWGTPLAGVGVSIVGTGMRAVTGADGSFVFSEVTADADVCVVAVDLANGAWRSRRAAQVSLVPEPAVIVVADFRLYPSAAAGAGALRPEGWWRARAGGDTFERAVSRLSASSREFAGITPQVAEEILAGGRDERSRARAALLALWLSMASGEAGPDAPVSVGRVRLWETVAVSASANGESTLLDLARDADAFFASQVQSDELWRACRMCCSTGTPGSLACEPGRAVAD